MEDTILNNSSANSSGNSRSKSKGEDALKRNAKIIGNYLNTLVLELFVSVLDNNIMQLSYNIFLEEN